MRASTLNLLTKLSVAALLLTFALMLALHFQLSIFSAATSSPVRRARTRPAHAAATLPPSSSSPPPPPQRLVDDEIDAVRAFAGCFPFACDKDARRCGTLLREAAGSGGGGGGGEFAKHLLPCCVDVQAKLLSRVWEILRERGRCVRSSFLLFCRALIFKFLKKKLFFY